MAAMLDSSIAGGAPLGDPRFDRRRDLALIGEVGEHLDAVEAALRRLDDGSYGRCVRCGTAISDRRLAEHPEAADCGDHAVET